MYKNKKRLLILIFIIFISLGLPDATLGAAWPSMYLDFGVEISKCGILSFTIAISTVISSLFSDKLLRYFKVGTICIFSTLLTCLALFCFSISTKFWMLVLFAVPYGLGAGAIDSAINNYVAVNYESNHMSWLHAMWGIGTIVGPYAIGFTLTQFNKWNYGYLIVCGIQIILAIVMIISLPLWKKSSSKNEDDSSINKDNQEKISIKGVFKIRGVFALLMCFFCYCSLESTANLWGSTYLVFNNNISKDIAASLGSMFLIGLTIGRILNGFFAIKFKDDTLIRFGQAIILLGIICLIIPLNFTSICGFVFVGFGCAPIYPSIMHSIPVRFGKDKSQSIIGLQMAFAYLGSSLMPPIFGFISKFLSISFFPIYIIIILIIMFILHNVVIRLTKEQKVLNY